MLDALGRLGQFAVAACLVVSATAASGQVVRDSARAVRDSAVPAVVTRGAQVRAQAADSLRAPVSPGRAFLTSLALPGLGQSRLKRPLPGAIYGAVEALSVVMLLKAQNDLRLARARVNDGIVNRYRVDGTTGVPLLDNDGAFIPADSLPNEFGVERVAARRAQVEDWIAVIIANHLFAGADAFVASLLWDLPARVGFRSLPTGLGVALYLRW